MKNYFFTRHTSLLLLACLTYFGACQKDNISTLVAEAGEELSGGENLTTSDLSENAFGEEAKGLTSSQETDFVVGNSFFRSNWVTAPASVQTLDGLGVLFNAVSCGSCHFKDGRAKPPMSPNEPLNGMLFRLSIAGGQPEPNYGGQLQDKAVLGVQPEATVQVSYTEIAGKYADGTTYNLRKPNYQFLQLNYGAFHANMLYSPRIAQQLCGLGLLEAVPETTILALEDEADSNKDGISGKANKVLSPVTQQVMLGRFGWKAGATSLKHQTAGAFLGDMGITSPVFPQEDISPAQQRLLGNLPNGGTPEIEEKNLDRVVFYTQTLSVPIRRNWKDAEVLKGKSLFKQLNCGACHTPKMQTGNTHAVSVLNNQTIYPYTDLLLHDMGEGLADFRPDGLANGYEWRTPPLWGLGMIKVVNKHTFLLHDGRARNIEEAILWHGGEAATSVENFKKLSKTDREAVLKFLESL